MKKLAKSSGNGESSLDTRKELLIARSADVCLDRYVIAQNAE